MTHNEQNVEGCEGLHRQTPSQMIPTQELSPWRKTHESSTAGFFASIFSYTCLSGIITINSTVAVKNRLKKRAQNTT